MLLLSCFFFFFSFFFSFFGGRFCSIWFWAPYFIWQQVLLGGGVFPSLSRTLRPGENVPPLSEEIFNSVSSQTHTLTGAGRVKHTEFIPFNTLNGYCDQIHAAAALLWQKPKSPWGASVFWLFWFSLGSLTLVSALGCSGSSWLTNRWHSCNAQPPFYHFQSIWSIL